MISSGLGYLQGIQANNVNDYMYVEISATPQVPFFFARQFRVAMLAQWKMDGNKENLYQPHIENE